MRYIIVSGKLFGKPIILANINGPNWDNPQFFSRLIAELPDINSHHLILGGDFNCVLDPVLDRSRAGTQINVSKSGEVLLSFLNNYKLQDHWRISNPTTRQYSFYSPVHRSYSRIDHFFVDDRSLSFVNHSKYHSIIISDHCPLQLDLHMPNGSTKHRTWCSDPLLLTDKDFTNFFISQIDYFFETSTTPDMSYSIIWEAFKVYIRGQIISYPANLQSIPNLQLTELSRPVVLNLVPIKSHIDEFFFARATTPKHSFPPRNHYAFENMDNSNILLRNEKHYVKCNNCDLLFSLQPQNTHC